MSANLHWEPANRATKSLSTALKWVLRKQYGEPVRQCLDLDDRQYLVGLLHGGTEDAQVLIDALDKHECIDVYEK